MVEAGLRGPAPIALSTGLCTAVLAHYGDSGKARAKGASRNSSKHRALPSVQEHYENTGLSRKKRASTYRYFFDFKNACRRAKSYDLELILSSKIYF